MRFKREEVRSARRLKALGLTWKPHLGDWYATDDGFISFVKGEGEGLHVVANYTWLPSWGECRSWLREHGYTHPEFARDEENDVRVEIMGEGGEMVSANGATDLECIYAIIAQVIDRRG